MRRAVLLVVAITCAIVGCEIEVPLGEPPPDARQDGAALVPDAGTDTAFTFDSGSAVLPDAATFD